MAHFAYIMALLMTLGGCGVPRPDASIALQSMAESQKKPVTNARLGFNEPIDSQKFGLAPNKNVDGKTLAQILTSQSAGRDDGILCSSCHHSADSQGGYGVPANQNTASQSLKPTDIVTGRSWAGSGGWAERFVKNGTKPDSLQIIIQAWINNGYK